MMSTRRKDSSLAERFPIPLWSEDNQRRFGDELQREVIAGFYAESDPGRDVRAILGDRNKKGDQYIDVRVWLAGSSTPTRSGIRLPLEEWMCFAELVAIVSEELVAQGLIERSPTPR